RIDLRTVVGRAVESFERSGELGRLALTRDFANEAIEVDVDPERATLAIVNALANAVRFARSKVRVHVGAVAGQEESARGVVTIEDDGPGVRAEMIPLLFDRAARRNASDAAAGSTVRGFGLV